MTGLNFDESSRIALDVAFNTSLNSWIKRLEKMDKLRESKFLRLPSIFSINPYIVQFHIHISLDK